MLIRHRKKPIAWLLIATMLCLTLIAPGGMVMANPLESGDFVHTQSMDQSELVCDVETEPVMDAAEPECDSCPDSTCSLSCYSCVQAQFIGLTHDLQFMPETERFSTNVENRLILFGHTPIPRPPRQLTS